MAELGSSAWRYTFQHEPRFNPDQMSVESEYGKCVCFTKQHHDTMHVFFPQESRNRKLDEDGSFQNLHEFSEVEEHDRKK